jgi:hypothetical protein
MYPWGLLLQLLSASPNSTLTSQNRTYDIMDVDFMCQYVGSGDPVDILNIGVSCGLVLYDKVFLTGLKLGSPVSELMEVIRTLWPPCRNGHKASICVLRLHEHE